MRFREILQEYDRSKTAQQMSSTIATSAERESQLRDLEPQQQVDRVLEKAEAADPTANKKYVLWIVRQFVKNQLKFEDINEFLEKDIERFHELPKKRKQQLDIETDINRYTWRDLRKITMKLDKATDLKEPVDAELDYEHIDDMKVLYVGDMGQLIIPQTEAASCEIGSGTRWCTAATQSHNAFSAYSALEPLYVWIPSRKMPEKKQSNKFQFHFGEGYQFMDENDERINSELLEYFRTEHPVLKKLFAKNEKEVLEDPYKAIEYALDAIDGRWQEAENLILQLEDPELAYHYAFHVIQGRWPEAEDLIKQSIDSALDYALYVIKGRWREAEEDVFKQDPEYAEDYASSVIKGRWPEAEDIIKQDPEIWKQYLKNVQQSRDDAD